MKALSDRGADEGAPEALAREALAAWGVADQTPELIARRENWVFRVRGPEGRPAALRLHRPGSADDDEIGSELAFMAAAAEAGLTAPRPIEAFSGGFLTLTREGRRADLLTWLDGPPLGRSGAPLGPDRAEVMRRFRALGAAAARLHLVADRWTPPAGFRRPEWSRDGLLGDAPVWGRFWENPALSPDQRRLIDRAREAAWRALGALSEGGDYGLIHADLVRENVLVSGEGVALIDFGDAGWGWRAFELATIMNRNREEPDAAQIEAALIEGYAAHRAPPAEFLTKRPLFAALRSFAYLGWIADRIGEPGAAKRQEGMIARAVADAEAYLRADGAA